MEPAASPASILPGAMAFVLLVAVPLTLVFSLAILALYRRTVKRLMLASTGNAAAPQTRTSATKAPSQPLEFTVLGGDAAAPSLTGPWRSFLVYALAGLGFAATMSVIYLNAIGSAFLPWLFAFLTLNFAWPLVIVWGLVAALTWRDWAFGIAVYAAAQVALTIAFFALAPDTNGGGPTPATLSILWGLTNAEITLLAPLILWRPIRAIGPLVFIAMAAAVTGATALLSGIGSHDGLLRGIVALAASAGLGGHQLFFVIMGLGAVAGGILGWLLLKGVGHLYRDGHVSDQSLIVDLVWLLYATLESIQRLFDGAIWSLAAFVPFIVFKAVCFLAFRWTANPRAPPLHLLLLRVFSLGRRSDALFRAIAKPWRHRGAIRLIAGPDLVATTVEPHEFLDFMSRNLARRFVGSPAQLATQLRAMAPRRDGDGCYRVDELFCHADTWVMALESLIGGGHAVLMDLRSFSAGNQGCVVEIRAILDKVPLERVVFVVDRTTDEAFLKSTFLAAWNELAGASPNRAAVRPRVRLLPLPAINRRAIAGLVAAIGQHAPSDSQKPTLAASGAEWQPLGS